MRTFIEAYCDLWGGQHEYLTKTDRVLLWVSVTFGILGLLLLLAVLVLAMV